MSTYERKVGLKAIKLAFLRRYWIILALFLPLAAFSVLYFQVITKKVYFSSITVGKSTIITNEQYQNIKSTAQDTAIVNNVLLSLKESGVKHSDGSDIAFNEIISGLSFPNYTSNQIEASFTYSSNDSTITKPVLDLLATKVCERLKPRSAYSDLAIYRVASEPQKDKTSDKYMYIFIAASFVVGVCCAYIAEISLDQVYDKSDVEELGCSSVDLTTK